MNRPLAVAGQCRPDAENSGYYECLNVDLWENEVEKSRLSTRAWAIQERLSARRVLHFGASQVFWECSEKRRNESNAMSWKGEFMRDSWRPICSIFEDGEAARQQASNFWDDAVDSYTSKHLTRDEDKLVAISGVARIVQYALKDAYVAGLWRKDLLIQLLWRSRDRAVQPPARWRAPSWSWASRNDGIIMHRQYGELRASIYDIRVKTLGESSTAPVSEARLFLVGQPISAVIRERAAGRVSLGISMMNHEICYLADTAGVFPDAEIKMQRKRMAVVCVPLLTRKENSNRIYGLLLNPFNSSSDPEEYTRVGIFMLDRKDIYNAYWPEA